MQTNESLHTRLQDWLQQIVVIDCVSQFVAVGTLAAVGSDFLELRDADMHDLRDSSSSREVYLVKTARLGVQANRKALLFRFNEVVGISRLADVEGG